MFPQLRITSTESAYCGSVCFLAWLSEATPESSLIFSIRNHFKAVPYPGSGKPVKVNTNDGLDGVTQWSKFDHKAKPSKPAKCFVFMAGTTRLANPRPLP